ncbi:MAG: ATP-grasp domain-containing protein [Pseudomonas sp.]|uniref:ATP-grasp domain-containing protein n=1 Tax=Pseudomonas sp. TaxID=306 RepID=UPI00299D07AE|nr:ATP-grasp domain-containing protein [Pseudomonas sp.]MDX1725896.1 ATP-grasp domain-containing protein [Pseudomonas sp.]
MIWFLQGQSSQRDVIAGAMDVINGRIPVIASHRQHRPEVTAAADIVLREPSDDAERLDWAFDTALANGVKVMLVGQAGHDFEAQRERFAAVGIDLVTGGMSIETFNLVDDKSAFTAAAMRAGLSVIPAITVNNADELVAALASMKNDGPVCVKPARGIYGMGFWRIEAQADPFRCFANAAQHSVNEALFVQAYRASASPEPLLVMPYMPGSECSVDMVVHKGKVIAHCARRKEGALQTFSLTGPAVDLAIQAAEFFRCDGIVNVQTRDDAAGAPHLLEINPRYSGGIGYTRLAGINLPGIFAASRLGLSIPATEWIEGVQIKGITSAVRVDTLS